ncbi:MAG: PorP/SprF family type IX secretion system membrane protein [Bacteroidetes bacterium]|nr:PorP/SprF family type IX secretion system membrane protein [Bacteroidota bacterium]MDA1111297.1 PorP/SprF family type IX secretion system membrane protein [Bacteroidota bacterium]
MKNIIFTAVLGLSASVAMAQQEQMYTHYDLNSLAMNPAYAGTPRTFTALAMRRTQWTDWPGAPVYNNLAIHSPVGKDVALGLNIQSGTIGKFQQASPLGETHVGLNLAYHKSLNADWRMAVGLRAGLFNYRLEMSKLVLNNPGDGSFSQDYSITAPMTGFGIYLYNEKSFVAFSSPRMVFVKEDIQNQVDVAYATQMHYFISGGIVLDAGPTLKIKPTTQVKMTNGVPTQLDVNVHAILNENLSLGTFYRTEGDVGLMVNAVLAENFRVLYSYDYRLNRFNGATMGSHEFGVQYQIPYKTQGRVPVPRFF